MEPLTKQMMGQPVSTVLCSSPSIYLEHGRHRFLLIKPFNTSNENTVFYFKELVPGFDRPAAQTLLLFTQCLLPEQAEHSRTFAHESEGVLDHPCTREGFGALSQPLILYSNCGLPQQLQSERISVLG